MKWLFALLLLVNIAYFLWQFAGPPRAQTPVPTHAPRAEIHPEKLKRLNEPGVVLQPRAAIDSDDLRDSHAGVDSPEAPAAIAPIPAPPAQMQCYTVGPFASVDAQTLAGIRLQELGLSYLERAQVQTEPVYRLFEGPFADAAAAEHRRRQLTRRGIGQHALTSEGENRYTIALGLFVQVENARAAQRDLTARGARPKLAQGKRAVTAYWLDTHALGPADVEALKSVWVGMPGVLVNEKTCPAPTAENGSGGGASVRPAPSPGAATSASPPTPPVSATPPAATPVVPPR